MPKILLIMPLAHDKYNEPHKKLLERYAAKETEIVPRNLRYGTLWVGSNFEDYFNGPYILEEVDKAEKEGFDAVILNCFCDPCLKAARELVKIPVLGPRETALHIASMLGTKFSIITVGGLVMTKMTLTSIHELGLESRLASIRNTESEECLVDEDRKKLMDRILEEARKAITEDGADAIVLGCTGLGLIAEEYKLQEKIGVPVVDSLLAALKVAEALITLKLSHSKQAYPEPVSKSKKPIKYPPSLRK